MKFPRLQHLEIADFRSIKGTISAPLNANTILVHGENGAGKTSLLSAIELALRGEIEFLELVDNGYRSQLLHRDASDGQITLSIRGPDGPEVFATTFGPDGVSDGNHLDGELQRFFRERCYLPQSLLNQLLKMYQDSTSEVDSPLSTFVSTLLGLKRLDAIETGLTAVDDIRNLRKVAGRISVFEAERDRLDSEIKELGARKSAIGTTADTLFAELVRELATIDIQVSPKDTPGQLSERLADSGEELAYSAALTHQQVLSSLLNQLGSGDTIDEEAKLSAEFKSAADSHADWQVRHGQAVNALVGRISTVLPSTSLPSALDEIGEPALRELRVRRDGVSKRLERLQTDKVRSGEIAASREVIQQNLETAETEIAGTTSDASRLSSALAEIAAFVRDDICPVCERDFKEVSITSLASHVNHRIRLLSESAQRLIELSANRGVLQNSLARLDQEEAEIASRKPEEEMERRLAAEAITLTELISDLERVMPALIVGGQLAKAEITSQRRLAELQARNVARSAARGSLSQLASDAGISAPNDGETVESLAKRIGDALAARVSALDERMGARRRSLDLVLRIEREQAAEAALDEDLTGLSLKLAEIKLALGRAASIRKSAQAIKAAVESVRSDIIRQEFNDRLNRLWRDLFVRLAPSEPYVPAFEIPEASRTLGLKPKLITRHRLGGVGGAPGAMLSAGNLNTAALTLFIALHLTMPPSLPWLILDDPVQSMDDIHIAHFAALLRTLAKEHGRQVIIAVHDRQLFEYLRLELSPAFESDTLQTLELIRSPSQDTLCLPRTLTYREESVLAAA